MDGRYNSFVATVPLPDGVQIDDSWFHEVDSAKTAYAASSGARPVFHTTVRTPSGVTMNNTAVQSAFVDEYTDTTAVVPETGEVFYPSFAVTSFDGSSPGRTFKAKALCVYQTAQALWSLILQIGIEKFSIETEFVSLLSAHPR
jgi:hypothetical protein